MDENKELEIDRKYGINTCGRDDAKEDNEHHAYEPTPYDVLELIKDSGFIDESDVLVDMGSGKGRVAIYFANEIGCSVKGIEYDEKMYDLAQSNLKNAKALKSRLNVSFVNVAAENYEVSLEDTAFFFFNPFSEKILETVLANIEKSYYEKQRKITLLFYYPSLEYVGRLMTKDYLEFIDEIDCSHLYKDVNGRECVMAFCVS